MRKSENGNRKKEKNSRREPAKGRSRGREKREYSVREQVMPVENPNLLVGRNAVLEALKSGRQIDKVTVVRGGGEGSVRMIVAQCRDMGIPVYQADRVALDRMCGGQSHQGVIAAVSEFEYCQVPDIIAEARSRGEDPFVMILDNLEDPHNLGAIMRSAECAGAHGIIIPKRRSVSVTDTVAKASAGAVEYMKVARVTNIARTIDELKDEGLWIAACDMGGNLYYDADLTGPVGVVIGSEGAGISKLVKEKCDFTVSMPMVGKITSLNASNAAAIIMYEIRKQRDLAR